MCAWDPTGDDRSPDRIDALVYAVSDLLVAPKALDYGRAAQPARGILRPSW
jgi:phage terminase large subunit-like protein